MGLRAFRTVFMGALAIRRPTPTWDFIILNKGLIEPPRQGEARPAVFQNFSPICVPSQKERNKCDCLKHSYLQPDCVCKGP